MRHTGGELMIVRRVCGDEVVVEGGHSRQG